MSQDTSILGTDIIYWAENQLNARSLLDPSSEVGDSAVDGRVGCGARDQTEWRHSGQLVSASHTAHQRATAVAAAGAALVALAHTDVVVRDHTAMALAACGLWKDHVNFINVHDSPEKHFYQLIIFTQYHKQVDYEKWYCSHNVISMTYHHI